MKHLLFAATLVAMAFPCIAGVNADLRDCEAGDAEACFDVGVRYDKGEGVKRDWQLAAKYYRKACEGRDKDGCFNLADMYDRGHGLRQSYSQAKEYFGKACDLGDQKSCDEYAKLNKKGY